MYVVKKALYLGCLIAYDMLNDTCGWLISPSSTNNYVKVAKW